jgi:transposase
MLQLHIELRGTKPKVWRRVLVPATITLARLHHVIQAAFGWSGGHLHEFMAGEQRYGTASEYDMPGSVQSERARLIAALRNATTIDYIYDFGDYWQLRVKLEKTLPGDAPLRLPLCVGGANATPPDDCGVYRATTSSSTPSPIRTTRNTPRWTQWIGRPWDPTEFDIGRVNALLSNIKVRSVNRALGGRLRQTLRLHLEARLSLRECARVLGISKTTVGAIVSMARVAGVDWAVAQSLDDDELEARIYRPAVPRSSRHLEPDFAHIHQELRCPGVTLQLLWEEYQRGNPLAYKYTAYCVKYRAWAAGLKRSMRQTHVAGEKPFVDYAGQTMPIVDAATGEIRRAQIFVAVLGASNYTCACATATQAAADWVGAIIDALEFIGGVPRLIVPDQPRALIAKPDSYDPIPGRPVQEFCTHYDVAVLPARPGRPRDKPTSAS